LADLDKTGCVRLLCLSIFVCACHEPASTSVPSTPLGDGSDEVDANTADVQTIDSATVDVSTVPDANPGPSDMLLVPAGTFTMGADTGGEEDEHPAHSVTLPAFWLDTTHVTNGAYNKCVDAHVCKQQDQQAASREHGGSDEPFLRPNHPVMGVSWNDAKTYCEWVGKRLPKEAEFERAMRGDDGRKYPWGNEPPTAERSVFNRQFGLPTSTTDDVGTHPLGRGPYGHEDLASQVWEWMNDEYDPYAYRRKTADHGVPGTCQEILTALWELKAQGKQGFTGSNPLPLECEHVLRGGAFNYDARGLRATNRVHHPGRFRLVMAGFRCAKDT
jgi:formylglycine-generating enzyme required for sulfatase activity